MSEAAFAPTEEALAPPRVDVRPPSQKTLAAFGVAALALATISALFVAYARAPHPSEAANAPYQLEVTAPPPSNGHATALFEYEGGAAPTAQTAKIAEDLRKESASAIARRDLDSAERLLGLCIRTADLPACHHDLGALLAVRKHASARAHYERYLATTPEPSSASESRVRRLLGTPGN